MTAPDFTHALLTEHVREAERRYESARAKSEHGSWLDPAFGTGFLCAAEEAAKHARLVLRRYCIGRQCEGCGGLVEESQRVRLCIGCAMQKTIESGAAVPPWSQHG